MHDATGTVRWVRAASALWRRLHDGVMLLNDSDDRPLTVTGPGRAIWELLQDPIEEEELVEVLAEVYGQPVDDVRRDIAPVLDELVERRLAERRVGEAPVRAR